MLFDCGSWDCGDNRVGVGSWIDWKETKATTGAKSAFVADAVFCMAVGADDVDAVVHRAKIFTVS